MFISFLAIPEPHMIDLFLLSHLWEGPHCTHLSRVPQPTSIMKPAWQVPEINPVPHCFRWGEWALGLRCRHQTRSRRHAYATLRCTTRLWRLRRWRSREATTSMLFGSQLPSPPYLAFENPKACILRTLSTGSKMKSSVWKADLEALSNP